MKELGLPAAFRRVSPSPECHYILVDAMNAPFEFLTPALRFLRIVGVWSMAKSDLVCTVADIPLQDKIPIAFDGVGEGTRSIGWRADAPSTLYWAEAQNDGDPNLEFPVRDCVFALAAPFQGNPRRLASLAWRFSGITWGTDAVAPVTERQYKTRSARSYLIAPGRGLVGKDAYVFENEVPFDSMSAIAPEVATPSPLASRVPVTSAHRLLRATTQFPHPAPELLDAQREIALPRG